MPKHAINHVTPARLVLGSAAAVLVILVIWVAVRAGGPARAGAEPTIIAPSARTTTLESIQEPLPSIAVSLSAAPSASASASGSPSPSPSASGSPSPSPSPSAAASPSRASSPSPSRTRSAAPSPSPATVLTAGYLSGDSWRDGFTAGVRIVNQSDTEQKFTVTLTFPSSAGVQLQSAWSADGSSSGGQVTLRGSVNGGQSTMIGFLARKASSDRVSPVTCTISGGSCRAS